MPESEQIEVAVIEVDHTSVILMRIIDDAPAEHFTLAWLVAHLPKSSFGVILLFLSLIALLPVISIPASVLILILTFQIIFGYHGPVLPSRLMARQLPSRYLVRLEKYAIPTLLYLEKWVRPRWPLFLLISRRLAAFTVIMLTLLLLITPIPFSNIPPAAICALISLAYIEHDGLLLMVALMFAAALLTSTFMLVF